MANNTHDWEESNFEITSKRRKGFPSETQVKRGVRVVHGNKELSEKLGRNDLCRAAQNTGFKNCCLRSGRYDGSRKNHFFPRVFAFALVVTHGDAQAKAHAFANLGKVCRIGTHLFHFAEYVNAMRGWGRGLRNAVAGWYVEREADDLAHQAVKYQQRYGWSHGDLLRLAHPKAPSPQHDAVFRWMLNDRSSASLADSLGEREVKRKVRGEDRIAKYAAVGELPRLIEAFERVKRTMNVIEVVKLIDEFDLPREAIPTQWLNEVDVSDALLQQMPMTAMVRNLGKMTCLGLIQPFSDAKKLVLRKLKAETALKRSRIHPFAVLVAQKIYAPGSRRQGCAQVVADHVRVLDLHSAFCI